MYVGALCECIALGGQKKVSDLQELELQVVVSYIVDAGHQPGPLEEPALLMVAPSCCQPRSLG